MKRIHVLRTRAGVEEVAGLMTAVRDEGLRVGWLDLTLDLTLDQPADLLSGALGGLERLARAGAARAVALGAGRSVAVKTMTGPPVLRDVLREHFVGCALVLVRETGARGPAEGAPPAPDVSDLPLLEVTEGGWRVVSGDGGALDLETSELAARLRRPDPWPDALRTDRRH